MQFALFNQFQMPRPWRQHEEVLMLGAGRTTHDQVRRALDLLGEKVLPRFREPVAANVPAVATNDPYRIGAMENMVAINAAVQIDLTGQVNSESLGTRQMSGTGGLVDFVRGAARSRGGRSIIAVPSTALGGKVSRIVPAFEPGTAVSVLRAEAHWIITEYGARNLRGMTLRERARALIEIAHPVFREELTGAARARHLLD